jgi:hypothetical protein
MGAVTLQGVAVVLSGRGKAAFHRYVEARGRAP